MKPSLSKTRKSPRGVEEMKSFFKKVVIEVVDQTLKRKNKE